MFFNENLILFFFCIYLSKLHVTVNNIKCFLNIFVQYYELFISFKIKSKIATS